MAGNRGWKVEDLLQEMASFAELSRKRPESKMVDTAWAVFQERLTSQQHLDCNDYLKLVEGVEGLDMGESFRQKVLSSIDALGSVGTGTGKMIVGSQTISNITPYLTQKDWEVLANTTYIMDVFRVVAARMRALGMLSLKETTKGVAAALVLWWLETKKQPLPTPVVIHYEWLPDFQKLFSSIEVNVTVKGCKSYPSNPKQLGDEWLKSAYGDEAPALQHIGLQVYYDKVPLRKTSHLLKGYDLPAKPHWKEGPCAQPDASSAGFAMMLGKFLSTWAPDINLQMLKQPGAASSQAAPPATQALEAAQPALQAALPSLPSLPACPAAPSSALPLESKPSVAVPVEPKPPASLPVPMDLVPQPESSPVTQQEQDALESFEEAAFDKLKARTNPKKAVAKEQPAKTGKAKSKVAPPPAKAPSKAVLKRPAAKRPAGLPEVLGCFRCRGNPLGCDSCKDPSFGGRRFQGRADYLRYVAEQKARHGKIYK